MPTASSQQYGTVLNVDLTDNGCLVTLKLNNDIPGAPPHRLLESANDFGSWVALANRQVLVTLTATAPNLPQPP